MSVTPREMEEAVPGITITANWAALISLMRAGKYKSTDESKLIIRII